MIKETIKSRILELGGNISETMKGTIEENIFSIEFKTPLYPKPESTPWAEEPIYGISDFFDTNESLFKKDKELFYENVITHYFSEIDKPKGQTIFRPKYFTPLKKGTDDYDEWIDIFDDKMTDLTEIKKIVGNGELNFIQIAFSYGFPDNLYICISDPNPENPTVFGTDHEVFFKEIENLGTLEDFFNSFMTKDELITILKADLEK